MQNISHTTYHKDDHDRLKFSNNIAICDIHFLEDNSPINYIKLLCQWHLINAKGHFRQFFV